MSFLVDITDERPRVADALLPRVKRRKDWSLGGAEPRVKVRPRAERGFGRLAERETTLGPDQSPSAVDSAPVGWSTKSYMSSGSSPAVNESQEAGNTERRPSALGIGENTGPRSQLGHLPSTSSYVRKGFAMSPSSAGREQPNSAARRSCRVPSA